MNWSTNGQDSDKSIFLRRSHYVYLYLCALLRGLTAPFVVMTLSENNIIMDLATIFHNKHYSIKKCLV